MASKEGQFSVGHGLRGSKVAIAAGVDRVPGPALYRGMIQAMLAVPNHSLDRGDCRRICAQLYAFGKRTIHEQLGKDILKSQICKMPAMSKD
ncbi:MAG: hypothetical protein ACYCOU_09915 [Sulfobacillus sp.]